MTISGISVKKNTVYHKVSELLRERFGVGSVFCVQKFVYSGPWETRTWDDSKEELRTVLMIDIGDGRLGKKGRQEYKLFFSYMDNGDYAFLINDAGEYLHEPKEDEPIELLYERHTVGFPKKERTLKELVDYVYEQVEKLKSEFRKTDFIDRLVLNIIIKRIDELISVEHRMKRTDSECTFFVGNELIIDNVLIICVSLFQIRINIFRPRSASLNIKYDIQENQYPRIKEVVDKFFKHFLTLEQSKRYGFDRYFDFSDKTILKQKETTL